MMMERKDLERILRQQEQTIKANMGGNMVARVVAINATTLNVQPVINKKLNGQSVKFPVFADVPPVFLHGGGSFETWPVSVGDYCLLVLCESCFDSWYAGLDEQLPLEDRRFDYSDCFAIVGLHNRAGALTIPSIITREGNSIHTGDHEHIGNTTQNGDKTQTGNITQTGNKSQIGNFGLTGVFSVNNTGSTRSSFGGEYDLVGDIFIDGISLREFIYNHTHSGVTAGGDDTGAPNV